MSKKLVFNLSQYLINDTLYRYCDFLFEEVKSTTGRRRACASKHLKIQDSCFLSAYSLLLGLYCNKIPINNDFIIIKTVVYLHREISKIYGYIKKTSTVCG